MIDQQTIILVIIGAVLAMLMIGGAIIGATFIIRPKVLLRKRMNQIGMIGDGGASDKAEGRRQRGRCRHSGRHSRRWSRRRQRGRCRQRKLS